jgi:DUF1009 family protein
MGHDGNNSSAAAPVGLIAGAGLMPVLTARAIREAGRPLIVAGLRGFADPELIALADVYRNVGVTRLGGTIRLLQRHGVREAVMIGSVRKAEMHGRFRLLKYIPDLRTARIWYCRLRHDKRDNAVLLAVADELTNEGIDLMSSTQYIPEHLASEGVMTKTQPSAATRADIEFAWSIARESARLDIGQSLAIRERDIIAVEAVEGTDAMIARAGQLCRKGGWTLIKVARPDQDMRLDVPTIGASTLKNAKAAGCSCIVIEAGKTLLADKAATLALADKLGIAIVGKIGQSDEKQ